MSEREREQPSLPGAGLDRFGWQPGDKVTFYSDDGKRRIDLRAWQRRVREAAQTAPEDRNDGQIGV